MLGLRSRDLHRELGEEIGLESGLTRTGCYVLAAPPEETVHFRGLVELRRRPGGPGAHDDPEPEDNAAGPAGPSRDRRETPQEASDR